MKQSKTNVMRLLDEKQIPYLSYTFELDSAVDGITMAKLLKKPTEEVFKTLVTTGASGQHYVYMIPVAESLNLKKAAAAAGEKSILMLPQKDLLPLTGYVHGGCSPIGMKKDFPTFLDETAILFDTITFSAGKIGFQVAISPSNLMEHFSVSLFDLT